jgi:AAA ATPase domain
MDSLANPFWTGAGNPPRVLAGREFQKEQSRNLLGRLRLGRSEQSIVLSGLRGAGKTVLLLEFESIADAQGWMSPNPMEIRPETDFRAELADAAREALVRLSTRKALGGRLKAIGRMLRAFKLGVSADGAMNLSFDMDTAAMTTGSIERDLVNLFVALGHTAKENENGVVFLVDEISSCDTRRWERSRRRCTASPKGSCPSRSWPPDFHSCPAFLSTRSHTPSGCSPIPRSGR